jgi:hypothetical protein
MGIFPITTSIIKEKIMGLFKKKVITSRYVYPKTNIPHIINSYGKVIDRDKKIIEKYIKDNKREGLYSSINNEAIMFGYDNEKQNYYIFGKTMASYKTFDSFKKLWEYFTKTYWK